MRIADLTFMLFITVAMSVAVSASAAEEKVEIDKLPRAIVDAVKARFADAKLLSAGKEDENGQIAYEVTL